MRELLAEYANEAPLYDVGSRALTAGRRRRALRQTATVAATLMLLAGVVFVWPHGSGGSGGPTQPGSGLAGYPSVIVPRPDAPALPADRAVGAGVLVYPVPDGYVLVAAGGTPYRLDPAATDYQLSPDGRWLAGSVPVRGVVVVRDLTAAGSSRELPGSPIAWSPDGRWLVLGPPASTAPHFADNPGTVRVADLSHPNLPPRSVDLSAFQLSWVVSVRADGDLVVQPLRFDGVSLDLSLVDPATATVRRHIDVDLKPFMTWSGPGTTVSPYLGVFGADGLVYVRAEQPLDGESAGRIPYYPVAMLPVDISTGSGQALTSWRLPEPRVLPGGGREFWTLLRVLPEGMLLRHMTPAGILSWDLYQPGTGALTMVTDLRQLGLK